MADGELADDLSITWGGKRLNVRANGQEVTGSVATEAEGAREAGCEGERRRRARKPTRLAALAHPGEYTSMESAPDLVSLALVFCAAAVATIVSRLSTRLILPTVVVEIFLGILIGQIGRAHV